jgi:GT2 family glycosyltransferase
MALSQSKRLPKNPLISVITPFRDNERQVMSLIGSLVRQPYRNWELILVSDRMKWVGGDKKVEGILSPASKGPGEKRNVGAKRARGEILFFLDSDCTVLPKALGGIVSIFENVDTDAVSGKPLVPSEGNLLGIATGLEYEDRFDQMGEGFVDIAATTCFAVKASAFKKFGGFKDYSTGEATGEDWDYSKRFTLAGYRIFHTNRVEVFHHHTKDSIKKWFSRRVEHSEYRITHKRRHGEVFEQYFSIRMFIETSLLFSIPVAIRAYIRYGRPQVFALPVFAILRNIAWFTGVVKGLLGVKK